MKFILGTYSTSVSSIIIIMRKPSSWKGFKKSKKSETRRFSKTPKLKMLNFYAHIYSTYFELIFQGIAALQASSRDFFLRGANYENLREAPKDPRLFLKNIFEKLEGGSTSQKGAEPPLSPSLTTSLLLSSPSSL